MVPVAGCWTHAISIGSTAQLKGYGQSAGYAQQALSAIRLVAAFGMEKVEIENYSRYLNRSKESSLKINIFIAFGASFTLFVIYLLYAYAFYVGSLFIEYEYYNGIYQRGYSSGDVIAVFFAVVTGLFSVGGIGTNMKSVQQGLTAGKMAFDTI